ncbi:zinc-dependent metalloprotease [Bacteroides xylanisolvens]|uniref:Zinc-dependent metalloprotease n=1 Tax=Bacteroides xylanisolvens TaxID=371601 RepID=A0A7J5QY47_9BACE|nr:zinc-dependent metalloprotease [Bacteroides xylanisolvens]KAB6428259.1 zinc-dependent metalloprotease [Bacteroides xylanisolvens]KAB6432538.1 zinc-dependent metalloprotease [Bacteroides xylanisolvens]
MNRKIIYFSLLSLLLLFTVQDACARKKKEKSAKTEIKGYENHLKDCVASDSTGLMIMHRTKDKVLVEFPVRLLEKEMLLASSIINISDNGEGVVGQFTSPEVMFRFVRNGKKLEARMMTNQPLMREETGKEGVASSLLKSASGGVYKSFKIEAFAKDSSSVLVNLAPLFLEHSDYSNPFSSYAPNSMYGMVTRKFRCDTSRSFLKDIHSYPDNISVTCVLGYDVDYTAFGTITMQRNVPVTVTAARMLVLLPETPMDIRYANQKVNTAFLVRKQYVDEMSPLKSTHLVKRWRLEPSDKAAFKRGEKVEPKKPIVFYIDTLMPDSWKPYIKEGVEEWNKSFEKIGYLNAVQAKEWPKGTDFSSSNIRHSSICYAPDWMYMAQTSMHTDPRTGEILNASVYIHHNFLSLLYSGRCTQTMASDPTARTLTLSEKQMGELLKVGIAQQVGRCLGLTDNMGASYHYPVDSLRSAEFTRQHGLTASVMDNIMCNYIAQPEDVEKGAVLVQPGIGPYDYFPIRYLYAPVVADKPEKELVTLNKWVEDAYTAHEYHYGPRQEFYALYDPTALYWDLGDDPFKAADYQIQNLKISIANFMKWYAKEDYDISRRAELYASLIKLFTNRAMELSFWIGGLYLDEGKEGISFPVSKEMQQKALNYLVKMSMDLDWLTNAEVKSSLELQDLIVDKTRKYIFQLLFDRIRYVALCSEKSGGEYSVKNYMDDIHSIVWKGVLQNRVLTNTEMLYQNAFIDYLVKNISKNMGGGTAKNAGRQQALRGDSFKMDIFNEANSFVMGWQAQDIVPVNSHQDASVYWDMLLKIRNLLSSRISSASPDMKEYYGFLIYKINQILDDN